MNEPTESAEFLAFKKELIALLLKHGLILTSSLYDVPAVWPIDRSGSEANDEELCLPAGLEDRTRG